MDIRLFVINNYIENSMWMGIHFQNRFGALLVVISFFLLSCAGSLVEGDPVSVSGNNPNGRNDDWGFVGYGGGGAMFYPAVSPHDPDFALVACDMTGSYVTRDGGESWRMFNLRGPVDYFVFDPLDSNTVYAHSIALFRSTDRAKTWSLFYPRLSEVQGVVARGDHASESVVTKDHTRRDVQAFAVDPSDSKKLYAVISIDQKPGFYFSADGGAQWSKDAELPEDGMNIFVVPSSSKENRTIYVTGHTTVSQRKDGAWRNLAVPEKVQSITAYSGGYDAESKNFILYAISGKSYFNADGDESGIFYSANGGETWENRQDGLLQFKLQNAAIPEWRGIATSAGNPGVVYVSYNDLQVHQDTTCLGVARSDDFGKTWTLSWKDRLTLNGNMPSANFKSGWINERFGPTWGENPFSIGVSPVDPDVCYATDFGRTIRTTDGGKSWEQVYTNKKEDAGWVSRGLEVTTSYRMVFDPYEANHMFIANTDVGLMESMDGGRSWASATRDNGIPRPWINSTYWLEFDPQVKGKAWAVMSGTHDLPRPKMFRKSGTSRFQGGILQTTDAGKTWKPVSAGIGEAAMTHILIDEESNQDSRTLYACAFGKGVYKSVDGGKSWQQKNKGIQGDAPFAWRITKRKSDGSLFLVVCRRSEDGSIGTEGDGALYRSVDGAESWTRMSLPAGTNGPMSIVADEDHHARLLLSAWGRISEGEETPDTGGGIFISEDDGVTWSGVLQEDQHIHDITFDERNKRYYACGFNGSAYRSDDGGNHWRRIKGYNFKWGKRVDPDPRDPEKIFIITFGGGIWYGPAAGDEHAAEDILPPLLFQR